jgi:hypothetical protein
MVSVHQIAVLAFRAPEASSAAFTFSPAISGSGLQGTLISRSRVFSPLFINVDHWLAEKRSFRPGKEKVTKLAFQNHEEKPREGF